MRFQLPDGQIVCIDTPFRFGDVNYPASWLRNMTVAEREAFGAVEIPEEPPLPPPPAAPEPPRWSWLEFIERFTEAEQLAIAGAAMSSVQVKLWYDKAVGADYIDPTEPRTVAGMEALVQAGLLTAERRDEILGGW